MTMGNKIIKNNYNYSLPCFKYRKQLIKKIQASDVLFIQGETGCGKSTGIPHIILTEPNLNRKNKIIITQPRRIATIELAKYVSKNLSKDDYIINKYNKKKSEKYFNIGGLVGYKVRFDVKYSKNTELLYMTDGYFLKELINNMRMSINNQNNFPYDYIIIDEVHERSMRIDLILCILNYMIRLKQENKIKLIIMSATLNINKLLEYFKMDLNLPENRHKPKVDYLFIKGRTYAIKQLYLKQSVENYLTACVDIVSRILLQSKSGNILIFCSGIDVIKQLTNGIEESLHQVIKYIKTCNIIIRIIESFAKDENIKNDYINCLDESKLQFFQDRFGLDTELINTDLVDKIDGYLSNKWNNNEYNKRFAFRVVQNLDLYDSMSEDIDINLNYKLYQLYSSQNRFDQEVVYEKLEKGKRKIILATNIAETSITLDNIKYVIDTGYVKQKNGFVLKECVISREMAQQRSGRAGRLYDGCSIRLYTKDNYNAMDEFMLPEILRIDLTDFIMYILSMLSTNGKNIFIDSIEFENLPGLLSNLKFIETLDMNVVNNSIKYLQNKNIISGNNDSLTELGELIKALPINTFWNYLICYTICYNIDVTYEIIIICAMCSSEIVWLDNNNNIKVQEVRRRLLNQYSDHIALHQIYMLYTKAKDKHKFCSLIGISERHIELTVKIVDEICSIVQTNREFKKYLNNNAINSLYKLVELKSVTVDQMNNKILNAIYQAISENIAIKEENTDTKQFCCVYVSKNSNHKLRIHPSSVLFLHNSKRGNILLYTNLIETNEVYMHNVSLIPPNWVKS